MCVKFNYNKTISGKLVDGSAFIDVEVVGLGSDIKILAMIDTGAKRSMIEPNLFAMLNLVNESRSDKFIFEGNECHINNAATGPSIQKSQVITLRFTQIAESFKDEYCMLPFRYPYPFLLGSDFLSRCKKFTYDIDNKSFELEL
jgi:hypothetical protein